MSAGSNNEKNLVNNTHLKKQQQWSETDKFLQEKKQLNNTALKDEKQQ